MKISLNWLKDFIDLRQYTPEQLAHTLTMAGLEVENIEYQAAEFDKFVVAQVLKKEKHPKADKLSLCRVFNGAEELQIVCGAPNVAEGQTVVLAQVGAKIPKLELEINPVKIRGIESFGMLCSERELGISEDHSGIMVLSDNPKPGTQLSEYLGKTDVVFEIGITPNRPDALSHIGVARDLSALLLLPMKHPLPHFEFGPAAEENGYAKVKVEDSAGCPRYSATVVRNVTVQDSPPEIRRRLNAVGVRAINNIVDITNYILYAYGQPLHAFDLDSLAARTIIVKSAGEQKSFITLDSKTRELEPDFLMICDAEKPVAMAGVMGGENSEVTTATQNILIESAYFNPRKIRKASKKTGLSSDSSYRFERGTNPAQTLEAAKIAAEMIASVGGGQIETTPIDVCEPILLLPRTVILRFERVERILGYHLGERQIRDIIINLGFAVTAEDSLSLTLTVPPWRPDIEREIDVIEEVARISGYDNIPAIERLAVPLAVQIDETGLLDRFRQCLAAAGAMELVSNSLVNQHAPHLEEKKIPILNPQSAEMSSLRTSLLPGILNTIRRNIAVGEKNLSLFETGHCFCAVHQEIRTFDDIEEFEEIAVALSGNASVKEWYGAERPYDFYDIKGMAELVLTQFGIPPSACRQGNPLEPGVFACFLEYETERGVLARVGKIREEILKSFDIQQEVYYFELNIDIFRKLSPVSPGYNELLRFPKALRDMAMVVDVAVQTGDMIEFIRKCSGGNLQGVRVFDIFENENLGAAKKSVAFALEFYNRERTLTDEEVEKEFNTIIANTEKEFNAKLRG